MQQANNVWRDCVAILIEIISKNLSRDFREQLKFRVSSGRSSGRNFGHKISSTQILMQNFLLSTKTVY